MEFLIKAFEELSTKELYAILALRSEVFVVEQECAYQDLDYKDQKAYHILGIDGDKLLGYTRVFNPGDYLENGSIGRVVICPSGRGLGLGKIIMETSIGKLQEEFPKTPIEISAQTYLIKFYMDLGFLVEGKEYLEDDIPHIRMVLYPR